MARKLSARLTACCLRTGRLLKAQRAPAAVCSAATDMERRLRGPWAVAALQTNGKCSQIVGNASDRWIARLPSAITPGRHARCRQHVGWPTAQRPCRASIQRRSPVSCASALRHPEQRSIKQRPPCPKQEGPRLLGRRCKEDKSALNATAMAGDDSGGPAAAAAAANGTTRRPRKPKRPEFEFFGPYLGPLGILLGLPSVCYALVYACNASGCMHLAPRFSIPGFPPGQRLFTWQALAVYCAWFAFQAALHLLLPGKRREGVVLPNGSRLRYKLNGALPGGGRCRCLLLLRAARAVGLLWLQTAWGLLGKLWESTAVASMLCPVQSAQHPAAGVPPATLPSHPEPLPSQPRLPPPLLRMLQACRTC